MVLNIYFLFVYIGFTYLLISFLCMHVYADVYEVSE